MSFENASANQIAEECQRALSAGHFSRLLALEAGRPNATRDILLMWIVGLPSTMDPAAQALGVLRYQQDHPGPTLSPALCTLLREVARYPSARLTRASPARRRDRLARAKQQH